MSPTTSFSSFEATLERAIQDGVLPGAVVAARDKSGSLNYLHAAGKSSLEPNASRPMDVQTIFPLASMTKLITSVAALQLIDRGLLTPETDISEYLPALASQPILESFDPATGEEKTTPRTRPLRFRHLLSHSSGEGYPFLDPVLTSRTQALTAQGNPPATGPKVADRYGHPLLFEPGTSWTYGSGIDWAGHLVEVLTGQDLETYLKENMLKPLGLPTDHGEDEGSDKRIITYYPERLSPSIKSTRMMRVTTKDATPDKKVAHLEGPPPLFNDDPERAVYGGEAGHATMTAYIEVLSSLLRDDGKLLSPKTAELLFEPSLEPGAKKALLEVVKDPWWVVGNFPQIVAGNNGEQGGYDHSLGGVVVDTEGHERRRKGFLQWGGMFNLSWFVDRQAGLTACFATSVAQPADPDIEKLFVALEEAVYAEAGARIPLEN